MQPLRVCFWATTFQSDNHALADFLARDPRFDVTVAMDQPERWRAEPVQALAPFAGRLVDKQRLDPKRLASEGYDLVVLDNHVPGAAIAPRVLVCWHGFGWRIDDLSTMRKQLSAQVGEVTRPNPRFRWHAFGEWDRAYRVSHSKLASDNVIAAGSPYSDWLRPESALQARFIREDAQPHYSLDLGKPVVMLGLTWHHGGSLGHWGDEATLLDRFFGHVRARGASTLVRMHDRHRYEKPYIALMEQLAAKHAGYVMLKWKSQSPDSLLDLLVSNVLVSNYSSLLNPYYYTQRPSIHIDPHDAGAAKTYTYQMFLGRPRRKRVDAASEVWKLSPDEHGGLRAQSFEGLLGHVDMALGDPSCCAERSKAFVARYIAQADGTTCARTAESIVTWCTS